MSLLSHIARGFLVILIRIYQVTISPWLGPCCRFHPSCSDYARQAIERHGCLRGTGLAVCRVLKCHPFHPGGLDPVPETAGAEGDTCPHDILTKEGRLIGHG